MFVYFIVFYGVENCNWIFNWGSFIGSFWVYFGMIVSTQQTLELQKSAKKGLARALDIFF